MLWWQYGNTKVQWIFTISHFLLSVCVESSIRNRQVLWLLLSPPPSKKQAIPSDTLVQCRAMQGPVLPALLDPCPPGCRSHSPNCWSYKLNSQVCARALAHLSRIISWCVWFLLSWTEPFCNGSFYEIKKERKEIYHKIALVLPPPLLWARVTLEHKAGWFFPPFQTPACLKGVLFSCWLSHTKALL